MLARLDESIYGYAFRNDTYAEGEYTIDFFESKKERDRAVEAWVAEGEIVLLEMNIDGRFVIQTPYA